MLEAVDLLLAVQQLVDVVRAGLVAHLDELERERRLRRTELHRIEHLRVRDGARLGAIPALLRDVLDHRMLVEVHEASSAGRSWNQKNPRGASVSRYGNSPIRGKRVRPNISSGTKPSQRERSSSTACAERATLWTQRMMSSSYVRTCAKMRGFSGRSASYVPRPNTGWSFRSAIRRCSQRRSEFGWRRCASTFTAWNPYTGSISGGR